LILVLLLLAAIAVAYLVQAGKDDAVPSTSMNLPPQTQGIPAPEVPTQGQELVDEADEVVSEPAVLPDSPASVVDDAPPPPSERAEPSPAVTQPRPALAPEPPPPAEPVSIKFNSQPFGISVFIDGVDIGKTPIQSHMLEPGTHTLLFQDGEHSIRQQIVVSPTGKSSWKYFQAEQRIR
jgi:hypothetical protein